MKIASLVSSLLVALALALALASPTPTPTPPTLTLLFSTNLTLGVPIDIGLTPFGEKLIVPITDGAFSGPRLTGALTSPLSSLRCVCGETNSLSHKIEN